MRDWGFWEWLAYASLWVAGIIEAAGVALMRAREVRRRIPRLLRNHAWSFLPLILLVLATGILLSRGLVPELWHDRLERIYDQEFANQTVILDGKEFVQCDFSNVTFSWKGGQFSIIRGTINGVSSLLLPEGSAIADTANLLRTLNFLTPEAARSYRLVPKEK
jgi:hypothetical protein